MSPTVTFVAPVPPYGSGIASHSAHLATALDERSERTVLSWHHQYPQLLFRHTQRSATAVPYPGARFVLRWWDPLSWVRAGRIARRSDVLLLTWTTPFHALHYKVIAWAARAGRGRSAGLPGRRPALVAVVHNVEPHEAMPLQRPLTRWVLGGCTGLVAHSSTVAEQLRELVPDVDAVVTTMPTLLEVAPAPLPPVDEIRLLFFGFVRPYKGLDVALDALVVLREEGLRPRLRIRGEFWEPVDEWRAHVHRRGLDDQVDLQPGYVPDEEVDGLLADCHAVVLPYRSASQSGVVPVAFAAGRPVVASNVGGFVDTVIEGVNGTLAEAGDARSLADAIRRLVDDLPTLATGTQKDQPTWDDVAEAVLAAAGRTTTEEGTEVTFSIKPAAAESREAQLAYSDLMDKMLDEEHRRSKARKLLSVIYHFLGRDDLRGLRVADVGCSAGFIADELAAAGGITTGFDIDQPGLAKASARFGSRVLFTLADGGRLPLADGSVDVIVFNHIYEHVVNPEAVLDELYRVLSDDGVIYLGFGNRLGIMEPHYRLPFLSYLPPSLADRYVRVAGRGDHYYERLRTRPTLRRLVRGFTVWDYTFSVIRQPERFDSEDMVPGPFRKLPSAALRPLTPFLPTYIWVAGKGGNRPKGPELLTPPAAVRVDATR